ncbi:MAG: mannose-1-phosphate guanylyltransferase/mannose-6-phosphate isomerase [Deltaproteobacteria bacterium]|nr:mannose-1-phosphate guanylyltransferase/mannose-6-phosphate isomerase [Deltaproteobacteria bacterium]
MIQPVILAGGSGTRLWPLSRDQYPKQLLRLYGGRTMLQHTLARLAGVSAEPPVIIANKTHRFFVAEQVRQVGAEAVIILEPEGKNTAPAVAVAALRARATGQDPVLFVLPADHYIRDQKAFDQAVKKGETLAEQGYCVTFGIVCGWPETGYGYIKKGAPIGGEGFAMAGFFEKPDKAAAKAYVDSGEFFWNSGMFLFKASVAEKELAAHAPEILSACREALNKGREDLDFFRLDAGAFAACPSDSVDYAVMEKTDAGAMVALDAGWSDLGSWEALWRVNKKDEAGNVVSGEVFLHDTRDSFLRAESRLLAAVGLSGHIVVETADAVLVAPRERVQDVRHIVDRLRAEGRGETINHRKVYRPWGSYETLQQGDRFQVKLITVKPGARLSLQKHFHRAEHWIVVRGTALVTRGDESLTLKEDESVYIPLGSAHRLENPGKIPLELIEVQSGAYLGEDDIQRFVDDYGR